MVPGARSISPKGGNRLGSQAKTIPKTHLQQTGRFVVVDRDNMAVLEQEAEISGAQQALKGAQVRALAFVFGTPQSGAAVRAACRPRWH